MSGHVFHPAHADLHGITVVLETADGTLYVGRYHEETAAGVLLHDVARHRDGAGEPSRAEFVTRTLKFGVRAEERHAVVPAGQVRSICRLMEWSPG